MPESIWWGFRCHPCGAVIKGVAETTEQSKDVYMPDVDHPHWEKKAAELSDFLRKHAGHFILFEREEQIGS